jgi:WD40 repeat protein
MKEWDVQTGQELLSLPGGLSMAFSPDGKRLANAPRPVPPTSGKPSDFKPTPIKVYDAQTGQELLSIKGHAGGVMSVVFSPDGKRLASASQDRTVTIWDAQTGQQILALKGHTAPVRRMAYSPDGKRLGTASIDQTMKVWDAQTGQELLTLKASGQVAFSSDGHRLACAGDGTVRIWDATPLPEKP